MKTEILKLENISCGYNSRPVLNDISFKLKEGEVVLLAGPNGCGKSTLLKAVVGSLPLSTGSIYFHGKKFEFESIEQRINSGIGYLRQTGNIFNYLSVSENLDLSGFSAPARQLKDMKEQILENFDFLKDLLDKRAGALSGGQRQALAIAMVFMHKRDLYLLDEPTAGLSPKAAADIIKLIRKLTTNNSSQTVLMVEHRLELLNWIDRAIILIQGSIKAEASDASLFLNPHWLAEHYF